MVTDDVCKKIIEYGIHAASGDNSQPWRFVVKSDCILIYNLPDRDLPFYNFLQKGSYVAHGGLVENMIIASLAMGYRAVPDFFPDGANVNIVTRMRFEKTAPINDALYPHILNRSTNRKPYKNVPLTEHDKAEILNAGTGLSGDIFLADKDEEMKILGNASSKNEIIALESRKLHHDFFGHMVWSEEEERIKKSGLYLKTLELPLPMQYIFHLLKYWPITKALNTLGFPRLAAAGNAKIYSSASAIGIIALSDNSSESYITAGRMLQRIWLTVEKLGLSLQPVTGLLFLAQRVFAEEAGELHDRHIRLIKESYKIIESVYRIENKTIALLFRIGHGGAPSARSSRMPPTITYE